MSSEEEARLIEIRSSPWEEVKEALSSWKFRLLLLIAALLIMLAGLTRVELDASSALAAAASLGRAMYVGFDVLAEPVGGRYSFAVAWALRSAFGFLFFASVIRPLLSLEGFVKAAVFLFALSLLLLGAYIVFSLYVGLGLPTPSL